MSGNSEKDVEQRQEVIAKPMSKAGPIARRGIRNTADFADMMSAMMSDLAEGNLSPSVANAMCNAGGKMLKAVEMEYRYGRPQQKPRTPLSLSDGEDKKDAPTYGAM